MGATVAGVSVLAVSCCELVLVERLCHSAHLQQLRDDGQDLWVADVDGIVPVGLLLVTDVSQVEDCGQQGEDPDETKTPLLLIQLHDFGFSEPL